MNLHAIVRQAITSVHPDEACQLIQSAGQQNVLGKITPIYKEPVTVAVNVQPLDANTLAHLERMGDTKASMQAFLLSDASYPVKGTTRLPGLRTGDFIVRPTDNTHWLITSVIEDWSEDGWANVGIVQQEAK